MTDIGPKLEITNIELLSKFMDGLVDELAKRVCMKITENYDQMQEFLQVRPKAENIAGLQDLIESEVAQQLEDAFDSLEVEIDVSAEGRLKR